jgi:glycosyltransferase involved in cell wall biosynthesis
MVSRSVSIVLPLHSAEAALPDNVLQVCDVLSDLTREFEVLLVDEGLSDHTTDMAHDLAIEYPQIRVAQAANRGSATTAIEAGVRQSRGDLVFIHQRHAPFSPYDLINAWEGNLR